MSELLTEKYRPQRLDDIIGRDEQVKIVKDMLAKQGEVNHLFLYGPPGTGKTTFAKCVANEVFNGKFKGNYYEFNASSDRGIDKIREEITPLAKERGFGIGKYKIILMDEADCITPDAQASFRRVLEEYSKITRFIFTGNYPYKLIPALISRFTSIEFPALDWRVIAKRLWHINKTENMGIEQDTCKTIAKKCNGDLRRAINMLQGGGVEDGTEQLEKLSLDEIAKLSDNEKVNLAFNGEPDRIFDVLWEKVKMEQAWDKIDAMANCNYKMNMSVHKTLFLAQLLKTAF